MDAQEDATPWTTAPEVVVDSSGQSSEITVLRGRSHFSHLGALRLKPSRPDAPPTLSKSCTDKLTLHQYTSLLSSLTSLLISPKNAYISTLVLSRSQYVESACIRAFSASGRMSNVNPQGWIGGYRFRPFRVETTEREFAFSRRSVAGMEKSVGCNLSAVCTPYRTESLIGGVLQGRKQLDPRGAGSICRRSVWKTVAEVAALVGMPAILEAVREVSYADVKGGEALEARKTVKEDVRGVLKGWVRNLGDEGFGIGVAPGEGGEK